MGFADGRVEEGHAMQDRDKRFMAARWEIARATGRGPEDIIFDRAMNRDGWWVIVLHADGTYRRAILAHRPVESSIREFGDALQHVINELMTPHIEGVTS